MQKYAIPTLILALVSVSVYALNLDTDPRILIEKENREKILKCLEDVYAQTGSTNMIRKIKFCESLPLLEITDNAKATTGSVIPVAPKQQAQISPATIVMIAEAYRKDPNAVFNGRKAVDILATLKSRGYDIPGAVVAPGAQDTGQIR